MLPYDELRAHLEFFIDDFNSFALPIIDGIFKVLYVHFDVKLYVFDLLRQNKTFGVYLLEIEDDGLQVSYRAIRNNEDIVSVD